jgi:tetratricopeptide (TPR) repeat protein
VRLYQRAIDAGRASDGAEALAEAWEQLGEELRFVGEPDAASRALTEARRLLRDDPIAQARLCDRHAEVAQRSAALSAAVRWLNRGFRCLDDADGAQAIAWRARMRSTLGGVRNRQGRWADAVLACRQAIEEAEEAGELRALAHACYGLDWALMELGHPEEATHSTRALEIYEQLGDAEHEAAVLNNLGMFAYYDGRWDDAVALYRKAGECSERAGTPADVARAELNVGETLSDQGHLDEAEEHLARARRVFAGMREPQAVAYIDVLRGRLATRRGDRDAAVPMLEAAMASLHRFKMDGYATFARALLAEAEAFAGDAERALEIAHQELSALDRNRPLLERVAGIALARLGKRDAALSELMTALDSARERASNYDVAATIDVLGVLGLADPALLSERDEILLRLKISRMPAPPLDG